jgi:RNA-directed DNA polymerase
VQQRALALKLRGHYGYYGRKGNRARLWRLRHWVMQVWWRWLCRRSQRGRLSWDAMIRLLRQYPLPEPRLVSPA